MSAITTAFASLLNAYQAASGATPLLTYSGESTEVIPTGRGVDPQFLDGGIGDAGTIEVMALHSDFSTLPAKGAQVKVEDLPAPMLDGNANVLSVMQRDGIIYFTLGNIATR